MRDPTDHSDRSQHQNMWEILPWYVNGTLDGREHDAVACHLLICRACADEVARCMSIAAAVRSAEETAWTPSQEQLVRLMARIEHGSMSPAPKGWRTRFREWLQRNLEGVQLAPSPLRWTLAVQTMLIVLLVGTVVWQASMTPRLYRTLSEGSAALEPGRMYIRMVFAEDITERELRSLLGAVQGVIVSGPSPLGVYTVSVPGSRDGPLAQRSSALERLRAHPKVRLAESHQP